jgi:hypothetical protein
MTEGRLDQKRIVRTSDHRSHYIIGAIPSVSKDDIRLHLFNEVVNGSEGEFHISNAQIIMTRSGAQRVLDALRIALQADGGSHTTEVVSVPQEVALGMESHSGSSKRKVQKIRVK